MGFWSKVKGVFGKIGRGIKKGWNWLTKNKEAVSDVVQRGVDTFMPHYSDRTRDILGRADTMISKTDQFAKRL